MDKNILIIEGNNEAILYYTRLLHHDGFQVQNISTDVQLLNYDFDIPDLFIVNSRFLSMTAVEICQHLKSNSFMKDIPIVIVSGIMKIGTLAKYCEADAYVEIPFRPADFITVIKKCLANAA